MDATASATLATLAVAALTALPDSRCSAQAAAAASGSSLRVTAARDLTTKATSNHLEFYAPGQASAQMAAEINTRDAASGRADLSVMSNADSRQPLRAAGLKLIEDQQLEPAAARSGRAAPGAYGRPTWGSRQQTRNGESIATASGRYGRGRYGRPNQGRPTSPSELRVRTADSGVAGTLKVVAHDVDHAKSSFISVSDQSPGVAGPALTVADEAANLLVQAHQISQEAETQNEYSRIVAICAKARNLGADGDAEQFARTLSAWALNRRGQLRNDEGQDELAMADFEAALELDASNWRALHNRAVTFAQSGAFAGAFDDFSRVIQLNPNHAKAFSNRATLYVQAGDLEKALSDFDRAVELDPGLFAAFVGRGRVCHKIGRHAAALEDFNAAIDIEPNVAEVVCSRADLQTDLGNYSEALADYATAIGLDPEMAHAYRNGAWLLATCPDDRYRDPENAIAGAKQALEFGYGDRHSALDTLAAALASDDRFEEAVGTLQQALDVAPPAARGAYEARMRLYEARSPFRIRPVATYERLASNGAAARNGSVTATSNASRPRR